MSKVGFPIGADREPDISKMPLRINLLSDSLGTPLETPIHSDNPLVWYEGATTTPKYYLYSDERGSITTVTSSTGGQYGVVSENGK